MLRTTSRKRLLSVVALASSLALVAGCGSGSSGGNGKNENGGSDAGDSARYEGEINIWAGSETPITPNFNPFSPTVLHGTNGPLLEPLMAFNKAGGGDPVPMLATDREFSEDGTELKLTIREGVKWNDGEDFTAEDVAFTFNFELFKPDYLVSAEADGNTVTLKFDGPQFTKEAAILQALIIPEHIWSALGDEATKTEETEDGNEALTFTNADNPVGTGPYKVENVSESAYTMVPNEHYWQDGKPSLAKLRYLAVDDNQAAEDLLRQGKIDWAAMFIPDANAITESGRFAMLNTPQDPTVLYTCSNADLGCTGAQTDVAVRQAINLAIDRATIIEKAFVGHAGVSNAAFTAPGRDDVWVADGIPTTNPDGADVDAAKAVLEDAGYSLNADGIYEKDGKAVELTLTSVDGWTDYNDAATLIEEQLAKAGIKAVASTISWNEFADARDSGNFELIVGGVVGTQIADPFQIYDEWFAGYSTTPVGEGLKPGTWNFARYANDEVDAAIKVAAGTVDEATKKEAYATVQNHIVEDVPYIPLLMNATMTFMNVENFTGWPTEDDLYMFPPSWGSLSAGIILGNLKVNN